MSETFERSREHDAARCHVVAELLDKLTKASDPLEAIDIKGEIRRLDPSSAPEALLVLTELVKGVKPGDLKKLTTAKDKAEALVAKKKAELASTTAKLKQEIEQATENYRNLTAQHAVETVAHNRIEAMRTGTAKPGFGQFANPVMQRWGRIAKLIKD